jgi:hypothetical protein
LALNASVVLVDVTLSVTVTDVVLSRCADLTSPSDSSRSARFLDLLMMKSPKSKIEPSP